MIKVNPFFLNLSVNLANNYSIKRLSNYLEHIILLYPYVLKVGHDSRYWTQYKEININRQCRKDKIIQN